MENNFGCMRFWDLCENISIDAAVALWCNVEPFELKSMGFSTSCMDAKREAIIDALRGNRLDYDDRPVPRSDGMGLWYEASIDEQIEKGVARINKESMRRWFVEMPFTDQPPFLFDEARMQLLPNGGEVAEMNTMRALAIMAWLLSTNNKTFSIGERPNAKEIGEKIAPLAAKAFGADVRGFSAFNKRISKALSLFEKDKFST